MRLASAEQGVIEVQRELAAREIAMEKKTEINLPFIAAGLSGPINLKMKLNPDDLG
jgi:hypothetical protein